MSKADTVARIFDTDPERVRAQYRKNAEQMRGFAVRAVDRTYRGQTADYWNSKAAEFDEHARA